MDLFLAQLVNGVALGSIYGLFAMGFGLVFSTMGILNAAHGTYATWAAITALYAMEAAGLPFIAAVPVGVLAGGVLAVVVDQVAFQPLRSRGAGLLGTLITSIAFWIILDSLAGFATGQQALSFPPGRTPAALFRLGGISVSAIQVISIVCLVVCATGLHALIRHSRFGAAMRAVGWQQEAASLGGVNSRTVIVLTAALAGATSGLAGVLSGVATQNISFSLGEGLLLKGFAAVVVGGYDDVRGTAIAGILLGVAEVFCGQYLSSSYRDGITYALLLTFLLVRPRGLFGSVGFVRA